jgi:hypothetical protein
LPYQLSIKEGLLSAEQVADEMSESDFNEISWKMEMETLWFGSSESCYFNFEDLDKNRKIVQPIYPKPYYQMLGNNKLKYPIKANGEKRILTMDIAVMGGSKNDATAIFIIQLIPTMNHQYIRNIVYAETMEGAHTFDQALKVRQMYSDFDIDYIVMDTYGVGIGVFDNLVQEQVDNDRNEVYPAWSCINDENMALRCKDKDAPKIIYSIKANQQFNSDCAVWLRDGIKRGKVKLLVNEYDGRDWLNSYKQYRDMSSEKQLIFEIPYYQTTALINELINLDYENKDGKIKISEQSGMRKDRYSSCAYGYYVSIELERELRNIDQPIDLSNAPICVSRVSF